MQQGYSWHQYSRRRKMEKWRERPVDQVGGNDNFKKCRRERGGSHNRPISLTCSIVHMDSLHTGLTGDIITKTCSYFVMCKSPE
jgi:hypothetical protein